MERLPVEIIRIIGDYVQSNLRDNKDSIWHWDSTERYWILLEIPFFWYAVISSRWQEVVEERTIPKRLPFQSSKFEDFQNFFRYPHRRANLRQLDFTISAVPGEKATPELLGRWSLLGGDPSTSLTDCNPNLLNFICQVHALFTEISTWTQSRNLRMDSFHLSIEAPYWKNQASYVDDLTVEALCILLHSLPVLPFVRRFNIVAPDLPPRLACTLLQLMPNIDNLRLHFSMPRIIDQECQVDVGIEHCKGELSKVSFSSTTLTSPSATVKGLDSLALPSLRALGVIYDVRPAACMAESQLQSIADLGQSVIRLAQRHSLDSLQVCGPFDPLKAGVPRGQSSSTSPSFIDQIASSIVGLSVRSLTVNTFYLDSLRTIARSMNSAEANTLLSCVRPQRLENWPSVVTNTKNPTALLRHFIQRYLELNTQQRTFFDAIVPGLVAAHAIRAKLPRLEEFHYADAFLVHPAVIHIRVIICGKEPNTWDSSWTTPFISVGGLGYPSPINKTDTKLLRQIAILLWDILMREPSARYLLDHKE